MNICIYIGKRAAAHRSLTSWTAGRMRLQMMSGPMRAETGASWRWTIWDIGCLMTLLLPLMALRSYGTVGIIFTAPVICIYMYIYIY